MMRGYNPMATHNDPVISISIPSHILRDLVLRSEENGSSIELELATRLARSLERDLEMIEADNAYALSAFNMNQH